MSGSIIGDQVQAIENGPEQAAPMNYGQIMEAQNALQQNIALTRQNQAKQAYSQALAGAIDPKTGQIRMDQLVSAARQNPHVAYALQDQLGPDQNTNLTTQGIQTNMLKNSAQRAEVIGNGVHGILTRTKGQVLQGDVSDLANSIVSAYPGDPQLPGELTQALSDTANMSPSQRGQYLSNFAKQNQDSLAQIQAQLANTSNIDTGGGALQSTPNLETGTVGVAPGAQFVPKTASPDTLAQPTSVVNAQNQQVQTTVGGLNRMEGGLPSPGEPAVVNPAGAGPTAAPGAAMPQPVTQATLPQGQPQAGAPSASAGQTVPPGPVASGVPMGQAAVVPGLAPPTGGPAQSPEQAQGQAQGQALTQGSGPAPASGGGAILGPTPDAGAAIAANAGDIRDTISTLSKAVPEQQKAMNITQEVVNDLSKVNTTGGASARLDMVNNWEKWTGGLLPQGIANAFVGGGPDAQAAGQTVSKLLLQNVVAQFQGAGLGNNEEFNKLAEANPSLDKLPEVFKSLQSLAQDNLAYDNAQLNFYNKSAQAGSTGNVAQQWAEYSKRNGLTPYSSKSWADQNDPTAPLGGSAIMSGAENGSAAAKNILNAAQATPGKPITLSSGAQFVWNPEDKSLTQVKVGGK